MSFESSGLAAEPLHDPGSRHYGHRAPIQSQAVSEIPPAKTREAAPTPVEWVRGG